jgi:hypothetical protein
MSQVEFYRQQEAAQQAIRDAQPFEVTMVQAGPRQGFFSIVRRSDGKFMGGCEGDFFSYQQAWVAGLRLVSEGGHFPIVLSREDLARLWID